MLTLNRKSSYRMSIAIISILGLLIGSTFISSCAPEKKGIAVFYVTSQQTCGNITVEMEDQVMEIQAVHQDGVNCYSENLSKFLLPIGTYQYHASDNCTSWKGWVTVKNGECWFEEIQ